MRAGWAGEAEGNLRLWIIFEHGAVDGLADLVRQIGLVKGKAARHELPQPLVCIGSGDDFRQVATGWQTKAETLSVYFDLLFRRNIDVMSGSSSLRTRHEGRRVEREFDQLCAARAFSEAFGMCAEHESAQLQQKAVAFADAQIGQGAATLFRAGRGENRQGAIQGMLRASRFPDGEDFLGGQSLHCSMTKEAGERTNSVAHYAGSTKVGSLGSLTS